MTGAFAKAALDWHAAGYIVMPLAGQDGKEPVLKHFNKWPDRQRPDTIKRWRAEHPGSNLGVIMGRRSNLTVIDVDNRDHLNAAIDRFGDTPVKGKSATRGFHLFYRAGGEVTQDSPIEGLEVDVKGENGHIAAPPSIGPNGRAYHFIEGGLSNLQDVPPLKPGWEPEELKIAPNGKRSRNITLRDWSRPQYQHCGSFDDFLEVMSDRNGEFADPLPAKEVFKTAKSVWEWSEDGNNWCGGEARAGLTRTEVEGWPSHLPRAGDAMILYLRLTVEHGWRGGDEFNLANAFAESFEWGLKRFRATRDLLENMGLIECLHRGGLGLHDPPVYRLAKVCAGNTNSNKSRPPIAGSGS